MKRSLLVPAEGLSLHIHANITLVCSSPSWTILLFPPKLRTGKPNKVPRPLNNFDSQRWRRKLNLGLAICTVIFKCVAEPSSHDLNKRLEIRFSRCERRPDAQIRVVFALIVYLVTRKNVSGYPATGPQQRRTQNYAARNVSSCHRSAPFSTCSIAKPATTVPSACITQRRRTLNATDSTYRVPFSPTRSTVPGMFTERPVDEICSTVPSKVRSGNTKRQFSRYARRRSLRCDFLDVLTIFLNTSTKDHKLRNIPGSASC